MKITDLVAVRLEGVTEMGNIGTIGSRVMSLKEANEFRDLVKKLMEFDEIDGVIYGTDYIQINEYVKVIFTYISNAERLVLVKTGLVEVGNTSELTLDAFDELNEN